jgi:chorismate mutase/prephenate dehydratase
MTKLESRPSRSGLWEYVFYMDIEGHQADVKVAAALAELKQIAAFVKVLGSYPVANQ